MAHGYENSSIDEVRQLLRGYGVDEETLKQTKKPLVELLLAYKDNIPIVTPPELTEEDLSVMGDVEWKPDEDVDEDELDTLEDTTPDFSSFNDLEVEINDQGILDIEGITEVLEQVKVNKPIVNETIPEGKENTIIEQTHFLDQNWSDYVMSQLTSDEVYNGYPKCNGLRRLVNLLVGPIISKQLKCFKSPASGDASSTISVIVECDVSNKYHPAYGHTISEESIADANTSNNKDFPYSTHMSSIAERRAESRVYRNLLGLSIASAEEMAGTPTKEGDNNFNMANIDNNSINQVQIMAIDLIAKRFNINVFDFINSGSSGKKYSNITEVTSDVALKMIETLNELSSGKIEKPARIGEYDPNWNK